jgi:hypothetical protein
MRLPYHNAASFSKHIGRKHIGRKHSPSAPKDACQRGGADCLASNSAVTLPIRARKIQTFTLFCATWIGLLERAIWMSCDKPSLLRAHQQSRQHSSQRRLTLFESDLGNGQTGVYAVNLIEMLGECLDCRFN